MSGDEFFSWALTSLLALLLVQCIVAIIYVHKIMVRAFGGKFRLKMALCYFGFFLWAGTILVLMAACAK